MLLLEIYTILLGSIFVVFSYFLLKEEEKTKRLAKEKQRFTYMMVHELRAPLVSLRDAALLLKDQKNKKTKRGQNQILDIIVSQAHMLLDEVSELLDAAKLESGKLSIQKVTTDIKKIIQDRITTYQPQSDAKHIKLESYFDDTLPQVSVDPVRITQVFNNLISNSLKFTPEGGKITISATKPALKSALTSIILISVADTGIGIAKDKQKLLFSQFVQIKPKDGNEQLGSGLGLYVVKGIIQAHGGKIWLDSDENQGTVISFTLPIA